MAVVLRKGDLCSANGPYIRSDGSEVKELKYLETVQIIEPENPDGDVFCVGLDSHAKVWIKSSSLTFIPGQFVRSHAS